MNREQTADNLRTADNFSNKAPNFICRSACKYAFRRYLKKKTKYYVISHYTLMHAIYMNRNHLKVKVSWRYESTPFKNVWLAFLKNGIKEIYFNFFQTFDIKADNVIFKKICFKKGKSCGELSKFNNFLINNMDKIIHTGYI